MERKGKIIRINGPVVRAGEMEGFVMHEMVMVGERGLIGEIIELQGKEAVLQVYEDTVGLKVGESVTSTGAPLSVELGPGIIGAIFDGIQRPLKVIRNKNGVFIPSGIHVRALDPEKEWDVDVKLKPGQRVEGGTLLAEIQETSTLVHRLLIPPHISGMVEEMVLPGRFKTSAQLGTVRDDKGNIHPIGLTHSWPVREPRPIQERLGVRRPLLTGLRVIDTFFPIGKGGTAAIPGGFGTGKTMTQHQLAKWSDADVIVYVGCGERGNEMTDVLEDFTELVDPRTGKSLMERTILIANTSNMPVAAREASIYTGIALAEYYRDMGYHAALFADSTSRWAEALREISGRLEEMPAEEGYPSYLPSRLAQFYERAGMTKNLSGSEGSITIIGAVSPPGGDFSEPVTQNTQRFTRCFWALDRSLASARHFPAINWLNSYSEYTDDLKEWMEENDFGEWRGVRDYALSLLKEEAKLLDIVKLVGEDVLPDDQKLILEIARMIRVGFLQQNAFSDIDRYVPMKKQLWMLKVMTTLYRKTGELVKKGVPVGRARDEALFEKILRMKQDIGNEDMAPFEQLMNEIDAFDRSIRDEYRIE